MTNATDSYRARIITMLKLFALINSMPHKEDEANEQLKHGTCSHTVSCFILITSARLSVKEHLQCVFMVAACSYIHVIPIKYRLMYRRNHQIHYKCFLLTPGEMSNVDVNITFKLLCISSCK